jgi:hypothetical protein
VASQGNLVGVLKFLVLPTNLDLYELVVFSKLATERQQRRYSKGFFSIPQTLKKRLFVHKLGRFSTVSGR